MEKGVGYFCYRGCRGRGGTKSLKRSNLVTSTADRGKKTAKVFFFSWKEKFVHESSNMRRFNFQVAGISSIQRQSRQVILPTIFI